MEEDWRLVIGPDEYLNKAKFIFKEYKKITMDSDHEHCVYCFSKISEYDGDLHRGYCTIDGISWICPNCFNDFKDKFQWEVVDKLD